MSDEDNAGYEAWEGAQLAYDSARAAGATHEQAWNSAKEALEYHMTPDYKYKPESDMEG